MNSKRQSKVTPTTPTSTPIRSICEIICLEVSSSLQGSRVSSRIRDQQQNMATGQDDNEDDDSDSDSKDCDSESDVEVDVDFFEEDQPKSPQRSPLHRRSRRQGNNMTRAKWSFIRENKVLLKMTCAQGDLEYMYFNFLLLFNQQ